MHRTRPRPPATVTALGPRAEPHIRALWREYFPPVEPRETAIQRVATPGERDWVGYGAHRLAQLVGFGLMTYTDQPEELFDLPAGTFDASGRVAAFYMTCVHPDHRHNGLGTRLGERRVEHAQERGVDRVVGIAWQAGEFIYRNLGFEQIDTVPDYYDHRPGTVTVWRREL